MHLSIVFSSYISRTDSLFSINAVDPVSPIPSLNGSLSPFLSLQRPISLYRARRAAVSLRISDHKIGLEDGAPLLSSAFL